MAKRRWFLVLVAALVLFLVMGRRKLLSMFFGRPQRKEAAPRSAPPSRGAEEV
ncbi:MAG: hypothetical protein GWO11_01455, partial [Desulfuromonadales bacterium]|nr:hypothetical protein [Desulfuromonadales bacterium]NIR33166.1 hypothetical protein [Desulfuromonadales bacterium]NIS43252.1 hypothetical protein [Desulfuromonadales bacterium]